MTPLRDVVDFYGGFARTRELLAAGASERMLTAAVRGGVLHRARNGWYSTVPQTEARFRAVRVGGKLTGMSALRELGVWEWRSDSRLHVAVRDRDGRLRTSAPGRRRPWKPGRDRSLVVHWEPPATLADGTRWSVGVLTALVRVVLDEPLEQAVLALDWAWQAGYLDEEGFEAVLAAVPARRRRLREWVDPASQSILETTARLRLLRAGRRVRSQTPVDGFGGADLEVEGEVALEVDGEEFHRERFEHDRAKDVAITRSGRHALRASWRMVRDDWDAVAEAIDIALLRRGIPPPSRESRRAAEAIGNSGIRRSRRPPGRRALHPRARRS